MHDQTRKIDAALDVPPAPRLPMTEAQEERLEDLAERSGESVDENMTMAEAERRIEELEAVAF